MRPSQIESTVMEIRHDLVKFFEGGQCSHDSHVQPHNAGLQLRRAISIQTEGKKLLRKMLSRRHLQGFVKTAHTLNRTCPTAYLPITGSGNDGHLIAEASI